jgi:hypothetical protein
MHTAAEVHYKQSTEPIERTSPHCRFCYLQCRNCINPGELCATREVLLTLELAAAAGIAAAAAAACS